MASSDHSDGCVRIEVPGETTYRGRVQFADGTKPSSFTVQLGQTSPTPFANQDGTFSVASPAGKLMLSIAGPLFITHGVKVDAKPGEPKDLGTIVVKRALPQWFFAITKYADELLEMDQIDWPEKIKTMQRNWIGRSTGTTIAFDVSEFAQGEKIDTFTTRIDTVYGVTFVVLAPEHPLVEKLTQPEQKEVVGAYVLQASRETEIERTSTEREKTGVETGAYCINPLNGERIPVLVGDYVLATYGTGAVMGVPAHDQRDFVFAKKYGLEIRVVVAPPGWDGAELEAAWIPPGTQVNSGEFDGLPSTEGMDAIADKIEKSGWGARTVT